MKGCPNRRSISFAFLLIFIAWISSPGHAQVTGSSRGGQRSLSAEGLGNGRKALRRARAIESKEPTLLVPARRFGTSERATTRRPCTIFSRPKTNGLPLALVGFDIACAYSAMGQNDKALATLAEAVQQGYAQPERMNSEPALQPIKGDPRFANFSKRRLAIKSPASTRREPAVRFLGWRMGRSGRRIGGHGRLKSHRERTR